MIHFKKARWRNLMRYGQTWTEIQLDRSPSTMILGKNGHGKSAILEAICFGLFGKPYRKIKRDQLINTKNGRDMMVEIEFTINDKEYLVRRGQRPNIFEIFEDGVLLNQPGGTRDYQKSLELDILRMDYASACQIVFVGKAQHTTFMQLNPAQRRQFIEVLLNLVIFSKMSGLHKQKDAELRNKISELKTAVTIMKDKAETRERYIRDLEKDSLASINADIQRVKGAREQTVNDIVRLQKKLDDLIATAPEDHSAAVSMFHQRLNGISRDLISLNNGLSKHRAQRQHLEVGHSCYACGQSVNDAQRLTQLAEQDREIEECENKIRLAENDRVDIEIQLALYEPTLEPRREFERKRAEYDGALKAKNSLLAQYDNELMQTRVVDQSKIETARLELADTKKMTEALTLKLESSYERNEYYSVISAMLNDRGIKAMLIRRFIPIINHIVNEKLTELGLFAKFTLDEAFDETIMIGTDQFNYFALSEGEKLRIDMALLIAWREIAKLQGNVSTNLLFFDEVFDSSLDSNGAEALADLMNQLEDLNVFIITHTPDKIMDKVRSIIKIERVNGFSKFGNVTENEE